MPEPSKWVHFGGSVICCKLVASSSLSTTN